LMNEANRMGPREKITEGTDLLMTAPVLLEAGDVEGYKEFRRELIERFIPAENGLQAEHLLKACLLLPVDATTIKRLESTAQVCRERPPTKSGNPGYPAWNALSLSLFHYRKGE